MHTSSVISAQAFRALNLEVDEDGFLLDQRQWSAEVAQRLAEAAGLGQLQQTQWQVIDFARDRYLRLGALPPMSNLCHQLGMDRDAVKQAFGSCRAMWQIAGLPNPGEEVLSYMN